MLHDRLSILHEDIKSLAFGYYLRHGKVPGALTHALKTTAALKDFFKFNPYHVPAGNPDGSQFTTAEGADNGGEAGNENDAEAGTDRSAFPDVSDPNYREPGLQHPLAPWEILLARNPVRIILGSVFKQAADESFYTINKQRYSSHSLDQMEARRIPPSIVENVIRNGNRSPSYNDTTAFYDEENNVTVFVGNKTRQVVTVRKGRP